MCIRSFSSIFLPRSIMFHLISMKPQNNKHPGSEMENRLDGRAIIVRLDSFVFTRLLSFLLLCVINMRASMADRRMDAGRMEGGRREGGCSCCLVSFCFLTDTTKSFRRGKTVVFVCRHRVMLLVPTEGGWMKELLRQQTHHPSVSARDRENRQREKWKTTRGWRGGRGGKRARDEDKETVEERDCERRRRGRKNRSKERLKTDKERQREQSSHVAVMASPQKNTKTIKNGC